MALCPYCSSELPENAKFCTNCGAPLNPSPSDAASSLPEEPQYPAVDYPESLVSDQEVYARPAQQPVTYHPQPAVAPVNTTGLLIWAIITALKPKMIRFAYFPALHYLLDKCDQAGIVDFLNASPYVRKVSYSQNASRALSSFAALVTYVGAALIGFLIFIALLLITNTIKLSVYIRKREINIMKYIGATDAFVRLPFVIEGMLIGILGAIIPTALIYIGYDSLIRLVESRFNAISSLFEFLSVSTIMQMLIPIFLILSVGVGIIGSSISMRKHLKV